MFLAFFSNSLLDPLQIGPYFCVDARFATHGAARTSRHHPVNVGSENSSSRVHLFPIIQRTTRISMACIMITFQKFGSYYRKMNVKFKRARHLHHPISWPSLGLQSYKLAWANACPNPDHTPIWSQIGKEMTDKSPILWALKQISKDSVNCQFHRHFFTDLAPNWCVIRVWACVGSCQFVVL